ncbi:MULTISPECIES: hypothetical protein [Curtobacterium]|nr:MULTISPECIES: hypothetical protein [Curtobacterium]MCS5495394.1 hypothetical protein [Curtobacterium flaccumfaciens pv. flaccumfaciens]
MENADTVTASWCPGSGRCVDEEQPEAFVGSFLDFDSAARN